MTIRLRGYQLQALAAEREHRAEHPDETRLAIVLPTGTGKGTIIAERACLFFDEPAYSVADLGKRVLIIVHTEELVQDLAARCRYAVISKGGELTVGIVKAGQDDTTADIIIASRQTLEIPERRARIADVGLVIVDEIHIGPSAYGPILEHFGCMPDCDHKYGYPCEECRNTGWLTPPTPALGFTATMERSDGAGLGGIWQNVVFTRDISWAVRKGYLVQPIGYRLEIDMRTDFDTGKPRTFSSDPNQQDVLLLDSIAPERIVEKWQELAADRQTIVFAPLVRSANAIRDAFRRKAGVKAETIYGDMPAALRKTYIARFKAGDIDVLCNAMVLTAGFDHPGIGCVIVARPTKSRTLFVQMAGRGLRPVPGIPVEEQDCILITLADGTTDLCSVADLSDRLTDRKADGPLTALEDQWDIGKGLEEAARHWTGRVDATKFDPIVSRSSKVWARTKGGHWFLPISDNREYVFIPDGDTDIYVLTRQVSHRMQSHVERPRAGLPDLELAMQMAEDEATERGGDLGALLADKTRPWRSQKPKPGDRMLTYASRLGLDGEVKRIMESPAGGKAGKISDLIRRVEATRSIDKAVERINARKAEA